MVLCGVVLWITARFSVDPPKRYNLPFALLCSTQVLTSQGLPPNTAGTAGRFVLGSWIVGAFFVSALCGGLFVSLLTLSSMTPTIDTLEQLEKRILAGTNKVTTVAHTSTYEMFEQILAPCTGTSTQECRRSQLDALE
ncbi:unnamed protein product [Cyprideis torosa]|uniref:Ionotropic glutamate receptor C-terminal domain-containing protein n=1 Tax=Cyprideis torosa TaxID=163714 RepID=A0A7R8WVE0_9CRUS|nr:unnamed protein product [Cyprideis torosa]CAG0907524.1 unnamed protein product [Cyprideis torosa]